MNLMELLTANHKHPVVSLLLYSLYSERTRHGTGTFTCNIHGIRS